MSGSDLITVSRDCPAMAIPAGDLTMLELGQQVSVHQELGNSITVRTLRGALLRVDAENFDALGLIAPGRPVHLVGASTEFSMDLVTEALDTIYDPEIPVSIMQLGLVYRCEEVILEGGRRSIEIDMSMTAPGCGMGDILRDDAERVVAGLPGVDEVHVSLVWDPPWSMDRMTEIARLELGMI